MWTKPCYCRSRLRPTTERSKRKRDVPWRLRSVGISVVLLLLFSCGETKLMSWESLPSGKGVVVAKTKDGKRSNYYLGKGTNRVVPLRVLKKTGMMFASLDSLLDFIKLKPADVMLFEATSQNVSEDDGTLEVLSAEERDKIWRQAKQTP
jgi:hypothetical protein